MSLFNDMLRDLEARGAPMPPAVAPLLPAHAQRPPRRWPWWLLASAVVAAAVGAYGWMRTPAGEGLTPTMTSVAPTATRPALTPKAAAVQSEPAPIAAPEPSVALPPTPATPTSTEAMPATVPLAAAAPTAAPASAEPPPSPAPPSRPESPPATTQTQVAAASPPAAASAPRTVVATATPVAGDFARRLQDVASLLAEGREREAEAELQALLVQEPGHVRARQTLASLYQRQARQDDAIAVWRQGLALNPRQSDWAQSLARVLLERGEPAQAATILAAGAPDVAANTEFHALLGYARQQAGQADLAAATYRELLAVDAGSGPWWLGLALAEQSRGDSVAALTAFRRARSGAGLETRVLRYVDARISALEASEP